MLNETLYSESQQHKAPLSKAQNTYFADNLTNLWHKLKNLQKTCIYAITAANQNYDMV